MKTVKLKTDGGGVHCPSCGNEVGTVRIVKNAKGHCLRCRAWFLIELPIVKKKLVYLDQSLMSEFCQSDDRTESGKRARSVFDKLQQLKALQKVFLVVSDIHSAETAGFPSEHADQSKRLWKFQNNLADGHIAGNWCDVFIAQQRRRLANPGTPEHFPSIDIGIEDPHRWQVGMQIVLTNTWRGRLHQTGTSRSHQNDLCLEIVTKQVEALGSNPKMHGALSHIRRLWRKDMEVGIAAARKTNELLQSEDWIKANAHNSPVVPPAIFETTVRHVVEGLNDAAALAEWQRQLDSNVSCAALRLRIAFEAEVLWSAVQGKPKKSDTKKFNEKYGVSRQNDINHVAAFAPYVDVLTTDDDMQNLCGRSMVKEELDKFPCQLFSSKNYSQFESWLDKLL